jgi:hypothetical protein
MQFTKMFKNKVKLIILFTILINLIFTIILINHLKKFELEQGFERVNICEGNRLRFINYETNPLVSLSNEKKIKSWILDSINYYEIKDLKLLTDSLNRILSIDTTEEMIVEIFTNDLKNKLNWKNEYLPDLMCEIANWSDNLNTLSNISLNYLCWRRVHNYWYKEISSVLSEMINKDEYIIYKSRFNYLNEKCIQNKFIIGIQTSNSEKIFFHLIKGNFKYLFNRINDNLPKHLKILLFTLTLATIVSYLIMKHKKKSK